MTNMTPCRSCGDPCKMPPRGNYRHVVEHESGMHERPSSGTANHEHGSAAWQGALHDDLCMPHVTKAIHHDTLLKCANASSPSPSPRTLKHSSHSLLSAKHLAAMYLNRGSRSMKSSLRSIISARLNCLLTKYACIQPQCNVQMATTRNWIQFEARFPLPVRVTSCCSQLTCASKNISKGAPCERVASLSAKNTAEECIWLLIQFWTSARRRWQRCSAPVMVCKFYSDQHCVGIRSRRL